MEENAEYGTFWGDDLYKCSEEKKPIIENIMYERDCMAISSLPGCGKSILALQLMCNLTTGKPFLDTFIIPKPCNVLYIQTEGDRAETIERLNNMKKSMEIDDKRWVHINMPSLSFNVDSGWSAFMYEVRKSGMLFDVAIIDPLYTTVKGSMCNDEVTTDWIRNIRQLRREHPNCGFIPLHHDGKDLYYDGKKIDKGPAHMFGSTFWSAFVNTNYRLTVTASGTRVLSLGKERSGKMIDVIHMKLIEPQPLMYILGDHVTDSRLKVEVILKGMNSKMHIKELADKAGVSRATIYRIMKELIENDLVERLIEGTITYFKWKEKKCV